MRFRNVPPELHPGSWRNLTPANDAARFWPACYSCRYVSPRLFMTSCGHIVCQDCVTLTNGKMRLSIEPSDISIPGCSGKCGACFEAATVIEAQQYEWFLHHAQFRCDCGFEGTLKVLHEHYSAVKDGCIAEQRTHSSSRVSAAGTTGKTTPAIQITHAPVKALSTRTRAAGRRWSAAWRAAGETEEETDEHDRHDETQGSEGRDNFADDYKHNTPATQLARYLERRLSMRQAKLDCIEELQTSPQPNSPTWEKPRISPLSSGRSNQADEEDTRFVEFHAPTTAESFATALPFERESRATAGPQSPDSNPVKMAASVNEDRCNERTQKKLYSAKITPRSRCRRSSEPVITLPLSLRAKILRAAQGEAKPRPLTSSNVGGRMSGPITSVTSNATNAPSNFTNGWGRFSIRRGSLFPPNLTQSQDPPRSPIRPDDGLAATIDRVTWFKFGIKSILQKLQNGTSNKIVLPTVCREIGGHKFSMACRVEDNESLHVFLGASGSSPDVQWPLQKRITIALLNGRGEVFSDFSFIATNLFYQPTGEAQRMICRMCPIHELANIAFSDESGPYITIRLTMAALKYCHGPLVGEK